MVYENTNCKPYEKGDRLILEVIVTDENISFDFLGKAITGRLRTEELGFEIDKVCFWKDRYINNIPLELRTEIVNKIQKSVDEIRGLIEIY